LLPEVPRRTVTYGTKRGSDFLIKISEQNSHPAKGAQGGAASESQNPHFSQNQGEVGHPTDARPLSRFRVSYGKAGDRKDDLGEFTLHVPGVHNILNATAAIAVGVGLDIRIDAIRAALDGFRGVDRRFHLRGQAAGVSVIDDYGHHPTEIKATLAAARQCGFRKVHVIFQPHRYTRTRDLMEEFTTAFGDADSLIVLDIYPASEKPIEGITGEALAQQIREKAKSGVAKGIAEKSIAEKNVRYAASFADAVSEAAAEAQEGDMIMTLGAGSVSQLGPMIVEKLKEREAVSTVRS
jgi:UDP-N-acetylmuramate--alanine ligase